MKTPENNWAVQDAKARFSEFLDACLSRGPQTVTRRGQEEAVLIPVREYQRLKSQARRGLKDLLLSEQGRAELALPERGRSGRRVIRPL
jgi:prevent-host-death family protein